MADAGSRRELDDELDLQALGYFVHIADARAFSKASTVLNVSQPTLTRHIQRLEQQFGTRLFDRTGRGVVLTEAGENLYEHSKAILARVQQAYAEITDIAKNPAGSVVLGLAPIAGKVISVPVARRFLKEVPNANLRIVECFTGYVREWVASSRIDVGILYADASIADYDPEPLWEESYVFISASRPDCAARKRIPFRQAAELPLVLPSPPNGLRVKIDAVAAKAGVPLNVVLEIDSLNVILDLVRKGIGNTILTPPALWGLADSDDLQVSTIVEPVISSTVVAVHSRGGPITNTTRELLRIIAAEARAMRQRSAGVSHRTISTPRIYGDNTVGASGKSSLELSS